MQPFYLAFDAALAALSARSFTALGAQAPWTRAGWAGTIGYCGAAIVEYSTSTYRVAGGYAAYAFLILLAIAFVIAGVRDEPQAEPWYWPTHAGPTRAQRRRDAGG